MTTEKEQLEAEIAERDALISELEAQAGDRISSNRYRAELYDEVWQTARDMGYGNVTGALQELAALKAQQPSACKICKDSGVVATTDTDHNGDHIERRCPACSAGVVDERAAFEQEFPRSHHASAVYWCEERQRYVGHGDAFENNSSAYQHKFENWKKARARLSPATAGAGVVLPERCELRNESDIEDAWKSGWNSCLDAVARLNPCRAQAVPDGWVPASERLPIDWSEPDGKVEVITSDGQSTATAIFFKRGNNRGWKRCGDYYISMWRPLPAAPSAKKESGQ